MAKKQQEQYGNSSISMLKGEDRVRKRPAVIFGSDDLEGCKHAVFEILSNAIDEAREGHGDTIIVTRYADLSVEVEDFGRGCPVDYNEKEKRYNWELVFCEMYAGGKYGENGENYEYSLGLNGLGSCATQYASEFFDAVIHRDGFEYTLHFEKGEITEPAETFLHKTPYAGKKTGSKFRWRPDLEGHNCYRPSLSRQGQGADRYRLPQAIDRDDPPESDRVRSTAMPKRTNGW